MINLIVEVDGYFENVLLTGRSCSIVELRQKFDVAKRHCMSMGEFTAIFCRLFDFELVPPPWEGIRIDFVIDTDTEHIYVLRY